MREIRRRGIDDSATAKPARRDHAVCADLYADGVGGWSGGEIVDYLETGMDPDGDFAGSSMAEVVDHSTSRPSAADRAAIAAYPRSVPAIRRKSKAKR